MALGTEMAFKEAERARMEAVDAEREAEERERRENPMFAFAVRATDRRRFHPPLLYEHLVSYFYRGTGWAPRERTRGGRGRGEKATRERKSRKNQEKTRKKKEKKTNTPPNNPKLYVRRKRSAVLLLLLDCMFGLLQLLVWRGAYLYVGPAGLLANAYSFHALRHDTVRSLTAMFALQVITFFLAVVFVVSPSLLLRAVIILFCYQMRSMIQQHGQGVVAPQAHMIAPSRRRPRRRPVAVLH